MWTTRGHGELSKQLRTAICAKPFNGAMGMEAANLVGVRSSRGGESFTVAPVRP